MILPVTCPECGTGHDEKPGACTDCGYEFEVYDYLPDEPQHVAFTVTFECQNCSRTQKHGFTAGDTVNCPPVRANRSPANAPNGLPVQIMFQTPDGTGVGQERLPCLTCGLETSWKIATKEPKRPKE